MRWTAEGRQTLIEGWKAGLSSGDIAKRIGGGMTRNGVARERSRAGLPARSKAMAEAINHVNGRLTGTGLRVRLSSGKPPKVTAVLPGPLSGSTPRPWLLRLSGECCFPVEGSGADTLSCCEPVEGPAGLYCWRHKVILWGGSSPLDEKLARVPEGACS